jgi:hypothetical protein
MGHIHQSGMWPTASNLFMVECVQQCLCYGLLDYNEEGKLLVIAVVDGHGGGIGSYIVKRLREEVELQSLEIIALGTDSFATSVMMKAKANRGASGENAIRWVVDRVDIIIGAVSVVISNSMLGEVRPKMAEAIANSKAWKLLLPLSMEDVSLIGYQGEPLPHLTDKLIRKVTEMVKGERDHVRSKCLY